MADELSESEHLVRRRYLFCVKCRSSFYEAAPLPFSESDQQKIFVSVSELTRNILDHACSKGLFYCELMDRGIRFIVTDEGPGILNIDEVLNGKKRSVSRGLGLGLSGVQRLMDEFQIETSTKGTKVVAIKWAGK